MKTVDRLFVRRPRGFALIITVVLVAFLVLILVGLATFTRVETQVADNSQQLAKARQNALMALNIAVGQLQKHAGPDQRVTATADLQPLATVASTSDPVAGRALNTGTTQDILKDIDDHWRDSRNRRWVGVWRDPDPTRSYVDPTNPAATVPKPQLLSWLVSGNETNGAAILPQTQVANFDFAKVTAPGAASFSFGTAASPYRLLVGKNTAGIAASTDLDRAVLAPEVKITSTTVPGLAIDPLNPPVIGHYAWWVGDEGVKARANLKDDFTSSPTDYENRLRLQSAQRPAVEAMTDMAGLYPANHADLPKILGASQLSFVNPDPAFRTELAKRYHDVTVASRGVLSDVRNGGLKGDLSWMLSHDANSPLRNELRALYGDNTITASDAIVGRSVFTPYSADVGSAAFPAGGNYALGLSRASTWAQLRSYFHMGNDPGAAIPGVVNSSDKAVARVADFVTHGISPLIVQAKLFYALSIDGTTGAISLRLRPLVVLANPYDVPLTGDFWVRFGRPSVYVYAGTFTAASPPPSEPNLSQFQRIVSGPGLAETDPDPDDNNNNYNNRPQVADSIPYTDRITLAIRGAEIPPGEARVYCLSGNQGHPGTNTYKEMDMTAGYDAGPAITIPSSLTMGAFTHAGLYISSGNLDARLFTVDPTSSAPTKVSQYVYGRPLEVAGVGNQFFAVFTTAVGSTQPGGGTWATMQDAQANTTQQANFLQFNPRTYSVFWTANSAKDHPLENTTSSMRNGAGGNASYFTADLMFDSTGDRVRWGPVNKANPAAPLSGQPVATVSADTGFVNILYSLPRRGHPISSVPQLQHFSPSGYLNGDTVTGAGPEQFAIQANTFQVNYPTGNSYPNPRVSRDRAFRTGTSAVGSTNVGTAYDASWLYNDVLADRFFFSTVPATAALDLEGGRLTNRNYRPFRPASEVPRVVPANSATGFRGAPRTAATNLLAEGAFNINSTSREAWKSILSSLRGTPVKLPDGTSKTTDNPFSRTLYPAAGYDNSRNGNSKDAWAGFHNLTDDEIADLADEIVLQIRRRGPFLSMADFMNRRLVATADDPMGRGLSGAVQAAIDALFNQASSVSAPFNVQSNNTNFAETAFTARTLAAGAPGYILQADLLSPLAPNLAARSDTFVVRAYGDVNNPATDEVTGRAWCEAVVQRLPDYVVPLASGGNSPDQKPTAGTDNERFGRRYQIVSFRWLTSDDI